MGEPFVKHIEGKIWELRPLRYRFFFFYWKDNTYVVLNYYIKKTGKTPRREIEEAFALMNDFVEREAQNHEKS
ncbi:MAG: type II toxin-antitoxin system RelE/ParE family toxin [Lachnospiraceae bacterium]|nr:type II toxin-antitoxin system RelE/ParE family toxin [Lachnospiraceae bacterium]